MCCYKSIIVLSYVLSICKRTNAFEESLAKSRHSELLSPLYDCSRLPGANNKGPEIFAVVDCQDVDARWDYSYQVRLP